MEKPFEFIESKMAHRREFDITEGRHPTYALLYLKEGSFRLSIDGVETIFTAGDCAIFTDDVFFSRSVLSPISFVYLKFRQNTKCSFTLPLPTGKIFFKNKQRFLDDIRTYEALMETADARSLYYKEHLLEDILWLWFDEQNEGSLDSKTDLRLCHDEVVRRAVEVLRASLSKKLSIAELCAAVGSNPSTLGFKFRREFSCSIGEFLTEERMKHARRLLSSTSFSVGEIATRCGYENIYYFSSAFHKRNGISPTEFRRQYR
ncbi:MAG: helix-turn-helix transcriptional regulator [Clostridia bacterium]|nr:helix-turn-helix transcriptional regulator [Clostridia bacterium]